MTILHRSKFLYDPARGRPEPGPRVLARANEARAALRYALEKGYDHWVITFSGGKDSTAAVVTSLEAALESRYPLHRIDMVYGDTLLEIPTIHQFALSFLDHISKSPRLQQLPLHCHIVSPRVENRFWVLLLGKGYPPPHQRFRWCTRRLKIEPVEDRLGHLIQPGRTVIVTGVRLGESRSRDRRLTLSCGRGGECGQGVWFQHSNRLRAGYLAPLIDWGNCDVWDYLLFIAPSLGYPTSELESVYDERETRFGCWMCTVVKQDRAMEKTVARPAWSHLAPLVEFRKYVWELTRSRDTRRLRSDGQPGGLKLEVRKALLEHLLKVQAAVGIEVISNDEIQAIQRTWEEEYDGRATLV